MSVEEEAILIISAIIIVPLLPFLVMYYRDAKKEKLEKKKMPSITHFEKSLSEQIENFLPDFDVDVFREYAYHIFKSVQMARSSFDYDVIRKYTTNTLYNLYYSELVQLKKEKKKKVIRNMNLLDFELVGLKIINQKVTLKVDMNIECSDYIEDEEKKAVNGTKKGKKKFFYEVVFTKKIVKKIEDNCPNCSAPFKDFHSTTCPYCGTVICNDLSDWKLVKIKEI